MKGKKCIQPYFFFIIGKVAFVVLGLILYEPEMKSVC